jgi:hypothetical protein
MRKGHAIRRKPIGQCSSVRTLLLRVIDVTTSAISAATTVGASSAPRLNRPTSIARADLTSPTVSAARAQMPRAARAKLSAARTIRTTYHHKGHISYAKMDDHLQPVLTPKTQGDLVRVLASLPDTDTRRTLTLGGKSGRFPRPKVGMATPVPYRDRVGYVSRSFDSQLEVVPVDLDLT